MAGSALVAPAQVDSPKDFANSKLSPEQVAALRWKNEIERAEKHFEKFFDRCDAIVTRYRAEEKSSRGSHRTERKYNALWSLVQTLQPNLLEKIPKPYVTRRFGDKDPIARAASMLIERALAYANDNDETTDVLTATVDDYILTARGVSWARYSPELALRESEVDKVTDSKGKTSPATYQEKVYEECEKDHVYFKDFLHNPCGSWKHVYWVSKRVLLTKDEVEKRFGEDIAEKLKYEHNSDGSRRETKESQDAAREGLFRCVEVFEIWDKTKRRVYWLNKAYTDGLLDEKDDPLKLANFFPCPKPMYGTTTNNTLVPVPDYKMYEDIAAELDEVTFRISLLTEAIRVVGVYDSQLGDLVKRITTETRENDMIPMQNWQRFVEGGGMKGAVQFLPVDQIISVLEKLYQARQALVQELYEITGISDIVRGSSDPRETAAAQKLKGSYASKRLKKQQKKVARHHREMLEIQTEIICNHYDPETIKRIASAEQFITRADEQTGTLVFDQQTFDEAIKLLKDRPLRRFRISIDNDSLAAEDIESSRADAVQFLQTAGQMLAQTFPMVREAQSVELAIAMKELLLFGIRAFPIGRQVEATLEQAFDKLAANLPPPPQKDAGGKQGLSPEEVALKHRELDIRREEIGVQRQLALIQEKAVTGQNSTAAKVAEANAANNNQKNAIAAHGQTLQHLDRRHQIEKTSEVAAQKTQADIHKHETGLRAQGEQAHADREFQHAQSERDRASSERQHQETLAHSSHESAEQRSHDAGMKSMDHQHAAREGAAARTDAGLHQMAERKQANAHENARRDLDTRKHASDVANKHADRKASAEQHKQTLSAKARSESAKSKKQASK